MEIQVVDMMEGRFLCNGTAPHENVRDYAEIERALRLLLDGKLGVDEIARQIPHLERVFLDDLAEAIRLASEKPGSWRTPAEH